MSQLQVTGEAKIRDIQGPVVANSGVITALDGAANQYVRGDGTLAIFPTSSGGGSSVSYYLNGSVNQGTFGGSTYYQMSRNAIVGTGTNFSTSSDGLIAQFITDANDPDVVSIPSGNWNVEFFMNVSASSGALASFYVEIYKYNGSTFTLLATNVATPEQLTNTTTVDAYFTSVAMPLSAMAVTDRLAVRVFANVASKTVTLYTEDNRLCQIVTTFSNGLTSLNNLTDQSQYLTTGTSGTDFNIVSSGDTHTFNIPSASATNRGLVTIGSQSFEGIKTFNDAIKGEEGVLLKNGVISSSNGYTALNSFENTLIITSLISGTPYSNSLEFTPSTSNTYTFPNATGTIALTSDLSSYVPYTGATQSVNLGLNNLTANNVFGETSLNVKILPSGSVFSTGYSVLSSLAGKFTMAQEATAGNLKAFTFDFSAWATNTSRTYTLPDITGTLALLEGTQTFSGSKTFSTGIKAESGIFLKELSSSGRLAGYVGISATATGGMQQIQFLYPVSGSSVFSLPTTGAYNYEFPIVSGTVALTGDLSSYVPYTGATTSVDLGGNSLYLNNGQAIFGRNFTGTFAYALIGVNPSNKVSIDTSGLGTIFGGSIIAPTITATTNTSTYININSTAVSGTNWSINSSNDGNLYLAVNGGSGYGLRISNANKVDFGSTIGNGTYTYTLPSATGTLALTSDLSAYVTLATSQTITGAKTFTQNLALDGNGSNAGTLLLKSNTALPTAIGYTSLNTTSNTIYLTTYVSNPKTAALDLSGLSDNIIRTFTFPNASGTLALTSNLSAYLPLTGGTLTGALSGTSATFSGNGSFGTVDTTLTIGGVTNANTEGKVRIRTGSTKIAWEIGGQSLVDNALTITPSTAAGGTTFTTPALTIASSGNLGLGVTPSAWGSNARALEYYAGSVNGCVVGFEDGSFQFGNNSYNNGGWLYKANGAASNYFQIDGRHVWRIAPSGTAGNAITFTQAMTLFANGNLSLGSTVDSGFKTYIKAGASGILLSAGTTSSDNTLLIQNAAETTTLFNIKGNGAATFSSSVGINGGDIRYRPNGDVTNNPALVFKDAGNSALDICAEVIGVANAESRPIAFRVSSVSAGRFEAMRITSGGNVGIGTSSPASKLHVYNDGGNSAVLRMDYAGTSKIEVTASSDGDGKITATNNFILGAGNTERMRITSGGNVGIGTSSPGVSLEVNGLIRSVPVYNNTTATAANLVVSSGGTFERSTSSLKYKKEIRNYDKGLNELLQIRPVYYKGKSESDGDKQFAGLIAEEIHDLGLTEFVQYANDGTPDALAYTHMIALLVSSIKEQQAQIEELKALIAAK